MKKLIIVLALLLISFKSFAQVTSPLLNCVDHLRKDFQFTTKFSGQTASVAFKGWTYDLRFIGAWVTSKGERVSDYQNQEITVRTTFPFDKYVSVSTMPMPGSIIASAFCQ